MSDEQGNRRLKVAVGVAIATTALVTTLYMQHRAQSKGGKEATDELPATTVKTSRRRPLVVCGPSGVGKGTLVSMLMKDYPDDFAFSVSHTTRPPRQGEEEGVHYHFAQVENMQRDIADGLFIESANVHGNYYGTSFAVVESVAAAGKVCVLDIDAQGAEQMRERSAIKPRYVFIEPPSMAVLEQRLRHRGTETEEKIVVRMNNAKKEMEYGQKSEKFDANIVNDSLEKAYDDLVQVLTDWYGLNQKPRKSRTYALHGYQIDYLATLAKAQKLDSPSAALQHVVDRVTSEEAVRQAVFDDFHCVHCGSVNPADWIKERKGKKDPHFLTISLTAAEFLEGDILVPVAKVGEPPKRQIVDGPKRTDKDKAVRCCIDWAIKHYGEDGKGTGGQ